MPRTRSRSVGRRAASGWASCGPRAVGERISIVLIVSSSCPTCREGPPGVKPLAASTGIGEGMPPMLLPLSARPKRDPVGAMGLKTVVVRLRNPADRRRTVEEALLVDSGAIYAVVPAPVLRRIGVRPHGRETFSLADGSGVTRAVGSVFFEIGSRKGAGTVIFGQPGDAALLGALTLEALGLMLDPLKRQLRPMRMLLA